MRDPNRFLSRRAFLASSAAFVAAACADDGESSTPAPPTTTAAPTTTVAPTTIPVTTNPVTTLPVPDFASDPFPYLVASGDPLHDRVVLWTRVALDPFAADGGIDLPAVPVEWEIGTDAAGIVNQGVFATRSDHGHSVHVDATGLEPSTDYWYRFRIGRHTVDGVTRTAPTPGEPTERLSFAVANCNAYKSGYFTAYANMLDEDIDAVLFVGDYIYELEGGNARDHGLDLNPTTLDQYRSFYAVARLDQDLARCHQQFPWIVMWDDHEVEDNYAAWEPGGLGLQIDANARENFRARRIAAYQAWWEFMPLRTGAPVDGELTMYRDFEFGDLVTLTMLDDRQYRSPIVLGEGNGNLPRPFGGGPQLEGTFDESRTMLGEEQEAWFEQSIVNDSTWSLLLQQTIMAEVNRAPDDPTKGYSMDAWDGYAAPRERLLGFVQDQGIENFVVVGGDIHTSAVADLHVSYREADSPVVGTEFVGPSATSIELLLPEFVEGARTNPHIHLYEIEHRGYLRIDLTHDELLTHYRWVDTALEPTSAIRTDSTWRVAAGTIGVEQV